MKGSLYHTDKNVLKRYSLNSEQEERFNGCDVTDVSFSNGIATFNGSTSVIYDNDFSLQLKSQLQGSIRIKATPTDATPSANMCLFGVGDASATNRFFVRIKTDGVLKVTLVANGTMQWSLDTDTAITTDNTEVDICIIHNGVEPSTYINGVKVAQTFVTDVDRTQWIGVDDGYDIVTIGALDYNGSGATELFAGSIELIDVYNIGLTSPEVSALYSNSLYADISADGLLLYANAYKGVIKDSANIQTLTNSGTTVVRDNSNVMYFDGSSYIDMTSNVTNFSSLSQGTICAWLKSTTTTQDCILGFSDSGDPSSECALIMAASGALQLLVREDGTTLQDVQTPLSYNDGLWHHVVVTVTPSDVARIYVDGIQANSSAKTGFYSSVNTPNFMAIGANKDSGGLQWYWENGLNDVRVYGSVKTAEEVARIYNSTKEMYLK